MVGVSDDKVLPGLLADLGLTSLIEEQFEANSLPHYQQFINYRKLQNSDYKCTSWQLPPPDSLEAHTQALKATWAPLVGVHFIKLDSRVLHGVCKQLATSTNSRPSAAAVSAASGVWDPATGELVADQLDRWKLTKGQVKHTSCLNNSRRDTERWLAPIKPHLQHLAAASSAGTSLVANLKPITVTLATWDGVWEVYLDPKWSRQRLRLYGAQDRALEQFFKKLEKDMAELSMERHGRAKQLEVVLAQWALALGVGPMQQPGSHTGSSLRAWAHHSPASKAQQAHQG
ncbi:uncharacterized protein HaLaN_17676 [Haematococcus lacustris]|uniref:Uncharacterized protein n=1 Tax=Haematococcus lacustris TaxID=44745 RepID=A0A699ZCX2_HAELA|nr:uncharacterized protein HaLaN_17676 [Haematococcus lacustris]